MPDIAILGHTEPLSGRLTEQLLVRLCERAGFDDVRLYELPAPATQTARPRGAPLTASFTLGANLVRIVSAAGFGEQLEQVAFAPDREQVRLATSAYLISELPLGKFLRGRYGAAHLNVEGQALLDLFNTGVSAQPCTNPGAIETPGTVVIRTDAPPDTYDSTAAHEPLEVWHAAVAGPPNPANVTWLGEHGVAWQCSTPSHTHFTFVCPGAESPDHINWHPSLQEAASIATPAYRIAPQQLNAREHWVEGSVVHVGDACYPVNPFKREAQLLGFEDAWVLTRMLENYEDAYPEALAEYEKYRKPRARRVMRHTLDTLSGSLGLSPVRRLRRNIGLALGTRFLPEIAMQKIDWFYQYDCIRGFH